MMKNILNKIFVLAAVVHHCSSAQYDLDFFLRSAVKNSPALHQLQNSLSSAGIQDDLIEAQNSLPQIHLTADYLFAPYFNNGTLVSAYPSPNARGYDVGITNGGLYSALVTADKTLLNGETADALREQNSALTQKLRSDAETERHTLQKNVTDQYLLTLQSLQIYMLSTEIAAIVRQQAEFMRDLVEKGLVKQSDYLLFTIEDKTEQIAVSENHTQYRTMLYRLYSQCGINDTDVVNIDSLSLQVAPLSERSLFLLQFDNDSLISAAEQSVFESKYAPQIKVFANAGLNAVELANIGRKFGMSAGIGFSLPLYDGSQRDLTRQQQELQQNSIGAEKRYFSNRLEKERRASLQQMQFLGEKLKSMDDQIASYTKVLALATSELRQGQRSVVEYLALFKNFIALRKDRVAIAIQYQLEVNNYNYWNW